MRFERKIIFTPESPQCLKDQLKINRFPFRRLYPSRQVNSLYFDSKTLSTYLDHINGKESRYKIRFRWYGDFAALTLEGQVEIKYKIGSVGDKKVFPLTISKDALKPGLRLKELFKDRLPKDLAEYGEFTPSLFTTYQREYFTNSTRKIRLTLDHKTKLSPYHPQRFYPMFPLETVIMELKYNVDDADQAEIVMADFPYASTRCSKYISGIEKFFT
jgi:hypothetical protein